MPEDKRYQHIKEKLKAVGEGTKEVHAALQPIPIGHARSQLLAENMLQSEPSEFEKVGDKYRRTKSYRF